MSGRATTRVAAVVLIAALAVVGLIVAMVYSHRESTASPGSTASPASSGAPVISHITAFDLTQTSARITWTLDVPATGQVEYGTTTAYGGVTKPELSFDYATHIQDIRDLDPGTLYHFRVKSTSQTGQTSVSVDGTFSTAPTSAIVATPTPAIDVTYDAVFTGDASGATDVTAALQAFLESNDGHRVGLAANGIYQVTQLTLTANDLTIDFRGARVYGSEVGAYGIFKIMDSSNIVVNDPHIVGTGYVWNGGEDNPEQWEHGIEIDGGSNITINNPMIRDTRGDGIYVGFGSDESEPPTGVVINNPNIERSARNGIAPVAGEVSIIGGRIHDSGLHGVDFEPNNDQGARSIVGIVDGVDIRTFQDLDVAGITGYAVAAAGINTATRSFIRVQNLTGDELRMLIPDTAVVEVLNNVSDLEALADFPGSDAVTFTGNVRITRR